ncbi:MAG: hypothetical protein U5K36_04240 [Roseovarius sp.]|nr:hypothetical protein [Roseovarius sp.]
MRHRQVPSISPFPSCARLIDDWASVLMQAVDAQGLLLVQREDRIASSPTRSRSVRSC